MAQDAAMKTQNTTKPRTGSQGDLYARRLEIGLTPDVWAAIRQAVILAREKDVERFRPVVGPAISKINSALSTYRDHRRYDGSKPNHDIGEPTLIVESSVFGWTLLADIILCFGDGLAKNPGGSTIVCACSQVLFGRKSDSDSNQKT